MGIDDETHLRIEGAVSAPVSLDYADLCALPEQVKDIGTLVPGRGGGGVWLRSALDAAGASASAAFVTLGAADGRFALSLPLSAVRDRGVLVYQLNDAPLPASQGGPVRIYIVDAAVCGGVTADEGAEVIDACANVKQLGLARVTVDREPDVGHDHGTSA